MSAVSKVFLWITGVLAALGVIVYGSAKLWNSTTGSAMGIAALFFFPFWTTLLICTLLYWPNRRLLISCMSVWGASVTAVAIPLLKNLEADNKFLLAYFVGYVLLAWGPVLGYFSVKKIKDYFDVRKERKEAEFILMAKLEEQQRVEESLIASEAKRLEEQKRAEEERREALERKKVWEETRRAHEAEVRRQKEKERLEKEEKAQLQREEQWQANIKRLEEQRLAREARIHHYNRSSGVEFENLCADLLQYNGFSEISATPATGDQGVDLTATKDGVRYAFQCKCYSTPVGNKPVQEVFTGKAFYNCDIAVVMTNSTFTKGAIEAAEKTSVRLWDGEYIEKLQQVAKDAIAREN